MTLVSLVVPIYNMEEYLVRCMDTLLSQTVDTYEIILVDDGSTDNSSEMCDKYADKYKNKIRVVHKSNGGLSSARNAGIEAAQGKYVVFPDPDDWVEPNYVEQMLKIQAQYNADLVCVGHYIDYDNKSFPGTKEGSPILMDGKQAQKSLLLPLGINGFAWNKLYHIDIIRKNELTFGDDVGTTEDLDFAYRYLAFCNYVCFAPKEKVYHYYQRTGAATHNGFSLHKMNSIHTYEKIIKISDNEETIRIAKEEICNTAINLLWMYCNSTYRDKTIKKKLLRNIKKYMKEYLCSTRFGIGRKVQAICILVSPGLYCGIKNIMTRK